MATPTVELPTEDPETANRLRLRQDEFAAVLGVDPESLRHLEFCGCCGGEDSCWTDLPFETLDVDGLDLADLDAANEYRGELARAKCDPCDGTGFKGGSFEFTPEEWQQLGKLRN